MLLIGLNFTAGAKDVNPERAVPLSPSNKNTSNAPLSLITLDRNSNNNPTLNVLFSDKPVNTSIVDVKNV